MIIGVGLDARLGLPLRLLREVAREAARLGFESVWTPAGGVPDSFHACAAWSADTPLRTGISVVPAARSWTVLALAPRGRGTVPKERASPWSPRRGWGRPWPGRANRRGGSGCRRAA